MVARRPAFHALEAPDLTGITTVADVVTAADADEHARLVWRWGRDVWAAWAPAHATVRRWNAEAL